ncbi:MAG: helix-turn-helix domain-containing protein [Lachnospiraceae bacterium]|nr:helix-turn-helix domain-containing protein [Lachnospiraceae bacterium]
MDSTVMELANIGRTMARIRKSQTVKWTQAAVADKLGVERSVYAKYESGQVKPSGEAIKTFADIFHVKEEELIKQVSIVIPDTSALLKNKRLLNLLLEDYNEVVIPDTVQIELNRAKDKGNKAGWQILMSIPEFRKNYPDKFKIEKSEHLKEESRDAKIRRLAAEIEKKKKVDVYIVHDDTSFTNMYDRSILLRDYMASRSKNLHYATILALDEEYRNFNADYYKEAGQWNLDEYLPDGLTLLISCIRHNYDIKKGKKKGELVPDSDRMNKIRFLLKHGADINKTDGKEFCFTPLAHCVQIDDFQAFCLLLGFLCHGQSSQ